MSIRKRNEFLEADGSDEELGSDHDSEAVEESRGRISGHANKRRKVHSDSETSFLHSDNDEDANDESKEAVDLRFEGWEAAQEFMKDGSGQDDEEIEQSNHDRIPAGRTTKKSSATKQAETAAKAVRKSGVVYISRVPPFMKPHTLKHFLEPHASKGLGRIFLQPEDHASHSKRVRNGGNKKKSFSDGWVEFTSKREAKLAAETLNGNIIGGKKGGFYHDDLWNLKYLSGFKWHHLTEQISNENAERAARLRDEVRKTRQENKTFVEDIERAKMLEGMRTKRAAKKDRDGGITSSSAAAAAAEPVIRPKLDFKQRRPETSDWEVMKPSAAAENVLSKIF